MDICKNADEYTREYWKLWYECFDEFRSKFYKFPLNHDREVALWISCFKPVEEFENKHPIKPLFIFKKERKYYKLKFIDEKPHLWISDKPIDMQLLNAKKSEWVKEITFPGCSVDVAVCPYCNDKFVRFKPHQKYCPVCQGWLDTCGFHPVIDPNKIRHCLNCGKHLPNNKHGKAKYCCGACRTAAYKKRKEKKT